MKKFLTILGILALAVCLFACSGNSDGNQQANVFEKFETGLLKKAISYERYPMEAELVGAIEGYKYQVGEGKVELYRFDEASEAYATAKEKQALTMEGVGDFSAKVENGLAMVISDLDESVYESIFASLSK